ncbi:MAG: trimethylamine methyltransferase family protein [Bacillota bacterium]
MRLTDHLEAGLGLNVFTRAQVEALHQATLTILEKTGVEIYEEEALALLKAAGAKVEGMRARIPAHLIEQALASAPSRIDIFSRQGEPAMCLEDAKIYFGTGSDTPFTNDLKSGKRRLALKEDTARAARVADALVHIDFVMSLGLSSDVLSETSDLHQFEAMLLNTGKPLIFTAHSRENMSDILEMAALAAGGPHALREKPFIILYAEPSSPLRHTREAVEKLLLAAEKRVPVIYTPAVIIGATGPVTLAGSLAVANSELLSGLVIHQLKAKGAPIIYGGGVPTMDMSTGTCTYGSPELHLCGSALAAMSRYYCLPIFGTAGCTDAMVFDQQAAFEAGYNLLMSALSGVNLIHDVGFMGSGSISSLELLVAADEGIGLVRRVVQGIDVSPETLAVDVIDKVGPGGNFITQRHTATHMRREMWFPKLFNRSNYDGWESIGAPTLGEKARAMAIDILASYTPRQLDANVKAGIAAVITAREKNWLHNGD